MNINPGWNGYSCCRASGSPQPPILVPLRRHWGSRLCQRTKGRESPDRGRNCLSSSAKARRGQAGRRWLAAGSALGRPGPWPSRETPGCARLPAFVRGAGAGAGAVAAARWPSVSPWSGLCWRLAPFPHPRRCCRMERDRARSGRGDSPSPPTQPCREGNFQCCRVPRSQGRFQPWLCCLGSCFLPGSAGKPGTRGSALAAQGETEGGQPFGPGPAEQSRARASTGGRSSPSPGPSPSRAIFTGELHRRAAGCRRVACAGSAARAAGRLRQASSVTISPCCFPVALPQSLPPKSLNGALRPSAVVRGHCAMGCHRGVLRSQGPGFLSLPSLAWRRSFLRGNTHKGMDPACMQPQCWCPPVGMGALGSEDRWG